FFGVAFLPTLLPQPARAVWRFRAVAFLVYTLLCYRCAMFVHELVRICSDRFAAFRAAWNFFCGTAFLTPTFVGDTRVRMRRP
ncbi:MAG: hypothetical protein QGG09_09095, partial [Pirellulaceae bacterium]|nr:hypothetical protein [Pirellulaceae bacterium]